MDSLRVAVASVALLVPSVVFAFNAYISSRERTTIEAYVPAALAFLIAAILALRRSLLALVLIVQALPLLRRQAVRSS